MEVLFEVVDKRGESAVEADHERSFGFSGGGAYCFEIVEIQGKGFFDVD